MLSILAVVLSIISVPSYASRHVRADLCLSYVPYSGYLHSPSTHCWIPWANIHGLNDKCCTLSHFAEKGLYVSMRSTLGEVISSNSEVVHSIRKDILETIFKSEERPIKSDLEDIIHRVVKVDCSYKGSQRKLFSKCIFLYVFPQVACHRINGSIRKIAKPVMTIRMPESTYICAASKVKQMTLYKLLVDYLCELENVHEHPKMRSEIIEHDLDSKNHFNLTNPFNVGKIYTLVVMDFFTRTHEWELLRTIVHHAHKGSYEAGETALIELMMSSKQCCDSVEFKLLMVDRTTQRRELLKSISLLWKSDGKVLYPSLLALKAEVEDGIIGKSYRPRPASNWKGHLKERYNSGALKGMASPLLACPCEVIIAILSFLEHSRLLYDIRRTCRFFSCLPPTMSSWAQIRELARNSSIPLACLPQLVMAAANAGTGDWQTFARFLFCAYGWEFASVENTLKSLEAVPFTDGVGWPASAAALKAMRQISAAFKALEGKSLLDEPPSTFE